MIGPKIHKNKKIAVTVLMLVLGMFAFAFAAFPLYNIFCKATGYGGTPKLVAQNSSQLGNKIITVRFNADVAKDMPWNFAPIQKHINVRTGENKLAFFTAQNNSTMPVTGIASFNVTPDMAGRYFHKIQCFCFNKQTLKPGEKVEMPVSFYVDPEIEKNLDLKDVNTITLSYTFFKATD